MYSTGIAYLLWLMSGCGVLGFHRFYLGKIPSAVLWMCTGGLFTVGAIYDLFTLPRQVKDANIREYLLKSAKNMSNEEERRWRKAIEGDLRNLREIETPERVILKIAKGNKGVITVSELALAANVPVENAKKELDTMVSRGVAELRVRQSGALVYTIPDLMDSNEPLI